MKTPIAFAALALLLAAAAVPVSDAEGALLKVDGGTSLTSFPPGDDVLQNKLGGAANFIQDGQLQTTQDNVFLSFFNLGSESEAENTLCAQAPSSATCWTDYNAPTVDFKFTVQQASAGPVDFAIFNRSPWVEQFNNATGFALANTGIIYAFLDASNNIVAHATNRIALGFNDRAAGAPDFDDFTAIIHATPVPAAVWGFGAALAGLIGLHRARRRRVGEAAA